MRHTCPLRAKGLPNLRRLLIVMGLPAVLVVAPAAIAQDAPWSNGNRDAGAESVSDLFQRLPSPRSPQSSGPQSSGPQSSGPQSSGAQSSGAQSGARPPGDRVRGVDIEQLRRGPDLAPTQTLEGGLLGASLFGADRAARIVEDELHIPPLIAPTTDQSEIGNSVLPADRGSRVLGDQRPLPEGPGRDGDWAASGYLWQAPNTYSHPLYFEDVMLERHGHERLGCLQPVASGARFFATVPMLPYLMAVRDPHDCDYHLGYYQVGSCAPPLLQRPPYDRRAALIQGGFIGGMILILP